ncbi:hypothetical protein [Jannaschia sp. R86511]|uniref:hypothetical protein n=1 Tax=Jannaschia sp. R86511 TaxID=3093853 RepID=UPI0036D24715
MRRTTVVATVVAAVLALGGCTLSGGEQAAPTDRPAGSAPATDATTSEPTPEPSAEGPSPEELSAQVIDAAAAPVGEPIASQTLAVEDTTPTPGTEVTIDVLSVQRTENATLLTMQMSSAEPGVQLGPQAFRNREVDVEFFSLFALEDGSNGIRYRPLSWLRPNTDDLEPADGPPNSCICPYRGNDFTLSPEPLVFEALYGPLPDGVTTVSLTAPGGVDLPDLPVAPFTN